MVDRSSPRRLLVEGADDERVIPELMEANGVIWGEKKEDAVVKIESYDGIENLLAKGAIETELKASGLKMLGVMVDANGDAAEIWSRVRNRCLTSFPELPKTLPEKGLIAQVENGKRLGVWVMPDNRSHGMIETFLTYLVPKKDDPVLRWAEKACAEASKSHRAPYKDVHADKAKIHTWLAWQDPPGRQLHDAVKHRILQPKSAHAAPFVKWFRSLYEI